MSRIVPRVPRTFLAGFSLLVLVALTYLPASLLHLTINPLYRNSGLVSQAAAGLTRGFPIIDPNAGTTTQSLGHLSAEQWLHGQVPWWNPYAGVGLPLAAEMQSEAFFLPFVLLLHFSAGVIWLRIAMQLLAGVATFMLLRKLQTGSLAALLGSVFYAFNGTFAWFAHGEIMPLPFLPLFLLGIEHALESAQEQRRGGWVLISISIAYSIYAGFPETAFMDGLLALLWAGARLGTLASIPRKRFFAKVCLGGAAGLLLAAPLMVPFFEYLQHSAVQHNDFGNRGLAKSSFLQLFLPYVYGPIEGLNDSDSARELVTDWGNIGGYFGITVIFLALLGLISERRERVLRVLLALWTVLLVARSISVPGTQALFQLVPGMNLVAIYRNSSGSFEMATAILAAFGIDKWQRTRGTHWPKVLISLGVTALIVAAAFAFGAPMIRRLGSADADYRQWLLGSAGLALLLLILAAVLCMSVPTRLRIALLSAAVILESLGLYFVPLLAGVRSPVVMDLAPITFLRNHIGRQRAYALGGIRPNYTSYYAVPFINHESLPVSDSWMKYVRGNLDPAADAITFSGDYPPPIFSRAQALRRNLNHFKDAGVRYVTAPRNSGMFEEPTVLPHASSGNIPVYLNEGQQIVGTLPMLSAALGSVQIATVLVGTDNGAATGVLRMQLCSPDACAHGEADLPSAADNAPLHLKLDRPLNLRQAQTLTYALLHIGSMHPVAIWMYPVTPNGGSATLADGTQAKLTPEVSFFAALEGQDLTPVFQSRTEDIFELYNPSPYFGVKDGACQLTIESHQSLRSSCPAAVELVRRELFYPGWRAFVNGREVPVRASSIFQSVTLPSGESKVVFRYVPANITLACLAGLLGVLMVMAGSAPAWQKIRRSKLHAARSSTDSP